MGNIFDKLEKIEEFDIIDWNSRLGHTNEPHDGMVVYGGQNYYFIFNHEFDCGNTYIVYDDLTPIYYFSLYEDIEGDIDAPMLRYEQ